MTWSGDCLGISSVLCTGLLTRHNVYMHINILLNRVMDVASWHIVCIGLTLNHMVSCCHPSPDRTHCQANCYPIGKCFYCAVPIHPKKDQCHFHKSVSFRGMKPNRTLLVYELEAIFWDIGTKLGANTINIVLKALYLRVTKMHDSSLDRVALSENLTFYMTTLRAAKENIKHRNDNVHRLQIIYKSDWLT